MPTPCSAIFLDPEVIVIECERTSVLGALLTDQNSGKRERIARLQVVVKKRSPTVRELVTVILTAAGVFESGAKPVVLSGFFAALAFAVSGVVDAKILSGWKVDGLIDLMRYDSENSIFRIDKSDLQAFQKGHKIENEFIEWLVEAGVLIDEVKGYRVNKLFKKGNILNII